MCRTHLKKKTKIFNLFYNCCSHIVHINVLHPHNKCMFPLIHAIQLTVIAS